MILFHGGCHGCTMQDKKGLAFCISCCYFESNWTLPNLNDYYLIKKYELDCIRNIAKNLKENERTSS